MLVPTPASAPRLLPDGVTRPFGNGLVNDTAGTPTVCGTEVLFEYPTAPYAVGLGAE
jgi:hypothetical protein